MSDNHENKPLPYGRQLSEDRISALEGRIMMNIEKKRRQVARMRWAVGIAWSLLLLLFIIGGFIETTQGDSSSISTMFLVTHAAAMIAPAILIIALFLTVSWYIRSVSLRFDTVQQALAAIYDQITEKPAGVSEENKKSHPN